MNAATARKTTKSYLAKLQRDHEAERKVTLAKKDKLAAALWRERGAGLVAKIEGYIQEAAARGQRHIWQPNSTNPNGDNIIYIGKGDEPIKGMLMNHFLNKGFEVEEYQYGGMKITW